jgi:secreted PhoX family phosphatase
VDTLDRRRFLGRTAAVAGGALAGSASLPGLVARAEGNPGRAGKGSGGYGPLAPTASENTRETILALPKGFKYTVFGRTGSIMSDGQPTPGVHDGMAAFAAPDGTVRLVRNHEVRAKVLGPIAANAYDQLAGGGNTTLVVNPDTRLLVKDFVSLAGTHTNCAGGPTPWGSWVTCEETVVGLGAGYLQPHGYNFEVPAMADGPVTPTPLKAMGRFVHEAIAVDPNTGWVYETEDRGTSGIYRFVPSRPGDLASGGALSMLRIVGKPGYDTRTGQTLGEKLKIDWVPIANPDPANAESDSLAVFKQGAAQGGATFARLEGAWWGNNRIYFHATSGGDLGLGQVWELNPFGSSSKAHLSLLYESNDPARLDAPDNIAVSPRGGLVLCEDGDGDQYVRGLTHRGQIFDFALNVHPGFTDSELAGATFSPDGETLFVNIQSPGVTLAIWGPWEDGAL